MTKKNVLIITSSGGGGHLFAAAARAHEIHTNEPEKNVIQRDVLLDWLGRPIGGLFAGFWNFAQKKGNVFLQKLLIFFQSSMERICWLPMFLQALSVIYREDIDAIIDTQPLDTSAILKAMRLSMKLKKKSISYEKVVVDLPTNKAVHYFRNIKNLSSNDRAHVKLLTTHPLLETHKSESEFWESHTKLKEDQIIYPEFPLRATFKEIEGPLCNQTPLVIAPRIPSNAIWECIQPALKKGLIEYDYCKPYLDIIIPPHARVCPIMLGSRPAHKATLGYVEQFIKFKQMHKDGIHDVVFVFCRSHSQSKRNLLRMVCELIEKTDFPDNLSIIPLTFQDDSVIAPLLARSNTSVTRSGGITSMELLSHMAGKIWIHSETPYQENLSVEALLDGIPAWEKGNAKYLRAKKGAEIIIPELLYGELTALKH